MSIRSYVNSFLIDYISDGIISDIKNKTLDKLEADDTFKLKMKKYQIKNSSKTNFTVFDVLKNDYEVNSMYFSITYVDGVKDFDDQIKFSSISELRRICSEDFEFPENILGLRELTLVVHYYYRGDSTCTQEYAYGVGNKDVYSVESVQEFQNGILEWIDKHPELLI